MPLPCKILCRALLAVFAVQHFFAVRFAASLPCKILCRVFLWFFAVQWFFAVCLCIGGRQRLLCRAVDARQRMTTHGKEWPHGNARFPRSAY